MYEITISDAAGFCFGVQRAVETVERVAGEGGCVVTLGPIVHNRHVVERFAQMGVREIASVDEAPPESTVIGWVITSQIAASASISPMGSVQ